MNLENKWWKEMKFIRERERLREKGRAWVKME